MTWRMAKRCSFVRVKDLLLPLCRQTAAGWRRKTLELVEGCVEWPTRTWKEKEEERDDPSGRCSTEVIFGIHTPRASTHLERRRTWPWCMMTMEFPVEDVIDGLLVFESGSPMWIGPRLVRIQRNARRGLAHRPRSSGTPGAHNLGPALRLRISAQ